jgi:hypothetical protein
MAKKTYYDYLRAELGGLIEQLDLPDLYKQPWLKKRIMTICERNWAG